MKFYEASSTIGTGPETIWAIITNGPGYTAWDNGVVRVEGTIEPGEKIKVMSEANPGRTFPVKVTRFVPPTSMEWSGGMPLGLFRGVRTFTLEPLGEGSTRFTVREEYTGPLLKMIWKSMPDLGPSFERFATGLKARAEAGH